MFWKARLNGRNEIWELLKRFNPGEPTRKLRGTTTMFLGREFQLKWKTCWTRYRWRQYPGDFLKPNCHKFSDLDLDLEARDLKHIAHSALP